MSYVHPEALVSTEWLAAHLNDANLRIADATYHLPTAKRDAEAEYKASHIPGAVFFDVDHISDANNPLPHMLPTPSEFAAAMAKLGIGSDDFVVVYDTYGLMSAARAWWMLRIFGHDRVAVLNGGLSKWKSESRPLESKLVTPKNARFTPHFRPEMVRAKGQVMGNLTSKAEQVLDARAAARFRGEAPEPRAGLRGGRIPGSCNLPYNELVDPKTMTVLPEDQLRARIAASGIDPKKPVITSCGSGVTACVLALGLHLIGAENVAVYDGSWSEWGLPGDTPVATG